MEMEMSEQKQPLSPALTLTDIKTGLSNQQYETALAKYGPNTVSVTPPSLIKIFILQFVGVMQVILLICAILSIVFGDYIDFIIILVLVIFNGVLGFLEERKGMRALARLTASITSHITVIRNSTSTSVDTTDIVPGDVIQLVGGSTTPADVKFIHGDVLSVDTAALTGEPIPRKYPSDKHGDVVLAGTSVLEGEALVQVLSTGRNTEMGKASLDVMNDKNKGKVVSLFERKILRVVLVVTFSSIAVVLIEFLVQGLLRGGFDTATSTSVLVVNSLAIIVASIPIALPIVMQVTMAIGAEELASKYGAVVTSLPALADIASMSVLCSDKTGTLTTAQMEIQVHSIVPFGEYEGGGVLELAKAACNCNKLGDPIDSAILRAVTVTATDGPSSSSPSSSSASGREFVQRRLIGFTPVTKRTLAFLTDPDGQQIVIAKGILSKILDTRSLGGDDGEFQWTITLTNQEKEKVYSDDSALTKAGYKTVSLAVSHDEGVTFKFLGILPMLDPPRFDTAKTIKFLQRASVVVKMITGDHKNIAIETGRLIKLGTDIHDGEEVVLNDGCSKEEAAKIHQLIWEADGFAAVMPSTKREVVQVLKKDFGVVVGMTGDGVNDAPALSAAQVGIAVEGATDAAKNAAAIILKEQGLSSIFGAVVTSRQIFRKVKSYVVFRIASSIFIVLALCIIVFISACEVSGILVIILAVLNDLSMLPIAYDRVRASRTPELPRADEIVYRSLFFGVSSTLWAFLYFYTIRPMQSQALSSRNAELFREVTFEPNCTRQTQALVWLYITLASEFLIFSVRVPNKFFWQALPPHPALIASVAATQVLVSILSGVWWGMYVDDIFITWAFAIANFLANDFCKVVFFKYVLKERSGKRDTISWGEFVEDGDEEEEEEEEEEEKEGMKKDVERDVSIVSDEDIEEGMIAADNERRRKRKRQVSQQILAVGVLPETDRTANVEPVEEESWFWRLSHLLIMRRTHRKLHKN